MEQNHVVRLLNGFYQLKENFLRTMCTHMSFIQQGQILVKSFGGTKLKFADCKLSSSLSVMLWQQIASFILDNNFAFHICREHKNITSAENLWIPL